MLYQMGQKIEVIVRKEDLTAATQGANEIKPQEVAAKSNPTEQGGRGDGYEGGGMSKVGARITATKILAAGIAWGRLGLNYYASGIEYRTGDSALQEATQRTMEMAEEGAGLIASVGIGATYGIRGGVFGAVLGGTLALATTALSLGIKYAGRVREYSEKVFKENNAIAYKRARANLSLTTGRLR